jgi:hypothetical protein
MCQGTCKHKKVSNDTWSTVFPQVPGLYWFWGQYNYSNAHDNPRVIPKMFLLSIAMENGQMVAKNGENSSFSNHKWQKGGHGWVGVWKKCDLPSPPPQSSTRAIFEP